jgi:hypothetical protein
MSIAKEKSQKPAAQAPSVSTEQIAERFCEEMIQNLKRNVAGMGEFCLIDRGSFLETTVRSITVDDIRKAGLNSASLLYRGTGYTQAVDSVRNCRGLHTS